MKLTRKQILCAILTPIITVIIAIIGCYTIVECKAWGKTFDNTADIPHRKVGLLLGTSPRVPNGAPNFYYINRITATANLYKAGKVDRVISSGGDYSSRPSGGYNELIAMRDSLVAHGVPDSVIILDFDGTRTLNSIVKAKEIYGVDSITIISQEYHNERAIFLASQNGIDAIGYNAKPSHIITKRIKNEGREFFARVKLFVDVILGEKPKFETTEE